MLSLLWCWLIGRPVVQLAGLHSIFHMEGLMQILENTDFFLIVQMATNLDRYHESCMVEPFVVADCQNSMHAFLKALTDLRLLFRRGLAAAIP